VGWQAEIAGGQAALVAVMKPADLGDGDDMPGRDRLYRAPALAIVTETLVRPRNVVSKSTVTDSAPLRGRAPQRTWVAPLARVAPCCQLPLKRYSP
jgi:hypothetical protein